MANNDRVSDIVYINSNENADIDPNENKDIKSLSKEEIEDEIHALKKQTMDIKSEIKKYEDELKERRDNERQVKRERLIAQYTAKLRYLDSYLDS
ncbi:14036_t:CDS:2 [Racocetra persica]|uniref:14036_t:CDS:1 n=1 Tax=Racocetra persica TaxID=160502 RepID=A0ACA9QI31_9GLOM|nr:14036_t:CDS:2 [Racocetra persica]